MIIESYKELDRYLKAFTEGAIPFLIIKSKGGLGKSHRARSMAESVKNRVLWFGGHATPLSIYRELFKSRNRSVPVIFDDVDTLMASKTNVAILKQLCELNLKKTIRYSTTQRNSGQDHSREFVSYNKVLLLCNDQLRSKNKDVEALMTRAVQLEFEPEREDILSQMCLFPDKDKVVLEFVKEHLFEFEELNFRLYLKAKALRKAGLDWKDYILGGEE